MQYPLTFRTVAQVSPDAHGFSFEHTSKLQYWQWAPTKRLGQVQKYVLPCKLTHVPLFKHGFAEHAPLSYIIYKII